MKALWKGQGTLVAHIYKDPGEWLRHLNPFTNS